MKWKNIGGAESELSLTSILQRLHALLARFETDYREVKLEATCVRWWWFDQGGGSGGTSKCWILVMFHRIC